LPGYRDHPRKFSTYTSFSYDELPPVERALDDGLNWLMPEAPTKTSFGEQPSERSLPATDQGLQTLIGDLSVKLPSAFTNFITSPELRRRIRSPTDCYLDLGEAIVPVTTGGFLIHFLSDSQFVLHWLLYVGSDGSEAVVATGLPYGYVRQEAWYEDARPRRTFAPDVDGGAVVCTSTFSEFLYRLWIENEIWFRLAYEKRPLTPEQQRYVDHYLPNGRDSHGLR
jgi:hypothetical protein